ncbi:Brp/Blh family beta-carotene 15,15'-dioxygenase [Winogradskyella litorisediminis]|uniref:Probable beta-carotene 15,15'-dioxygenase n=1 Tax=Winogradskyella litorisediminis TaxID=1156618 RepID=A0ABW3NBD5_9FLAO
MKNIQNFNIVITFLSLWLAVFLNTVAESYLACFFILTVGLLHGSNDIKIIRTVLKNKKLSFYRTLTIYVSIVLLGILLFFFVPAVTLMLFVLVSGYHFGEQHFHDLPIKSKIIKTLLFTSYGCTIVFLLLYTNAVESIEIIHQITEIYITKLILKISFFASLGLFMLLFGFNYKKFKSPIRELFYLVVFFIVFKTASLLWAFAIYFVIWHSLPSVIHQISYLSKEVNKTTILNYLKSSFIYWFVSVVGLFILLLFLVKEQDLFYGVFFSFLAAITFPHIFVMTKIFKH